MPTTVEGYRTMARAARKGTVEDLEKAISALTQVRGTTNHNDSADLLNKPLDKDKRAALHLAAYHGNIDVINYLLGQGADINIKDLGGNTPLALACIQHQEKAKQLLCNKGASLCIENKNGLFPQNAGFLVRAYKAILENNSPFLNRLLTPSRHLYYRRNDQDNDGNTLLHHAVIEEATECMNILLKRKKSVNPLVKNAMDKAPGELAAHRGNLELASQLHACRFLRSTLTTDIEKKYERSTLFSQETGPVRVRRFFKGKRDSPSAPYETHKTPLIRS